MQPDQRNLGGRQLILTHLLNHRLQLRSIQEREQQLVSPRPIKKNQKTKLIIQGSQTDRKCTKKLEQPYFFRRLPSPPTKYKNLLYQLPLNFPKTKKWKKSDKSIKNRFYKQIQGEIDWEGLLLELKKLGESIYNIKLKPFLYDLAVSYQIYADYDFAILIRLIMSQFPLFKQNLIVDIIADIIQDLEN